MWDKLVVNSVKDKRHLVLQTLCAVVFIAVSLWLLELTSSSAILWSAGASALASSAFTVFAIPHSPTAKASRIVRGYLIAIVVGSFFGWVLQGLCPILCSNAPIIDRHLFWVSAAIAVGVAMILMIFFGGEHPPAAGICLILVIDVRHLLVIAVIFGCISLLAFIQYYFADWLHDYLELSESQ